MKVSIAAISFEDRCLALPERLHRVRKSSPFILLDFTGYDEVAPYVSNRSDMIRLIEHKGYTVELIPCREVAPLAAMEEIRRLIEGVPEPKVLFDISAMPRNYILTISKLLADSNIEVEFQYNRPRDYGSELSRGVRSIQAVPGFEGMTSPGGEVTLVLILGFEGYKALYAWERIGPNKLHALFGSPPYKASFLKRSKANNAELLRVAADRVKVGTIHTSNTELIRSHLQQLYDEVTRTSGSGSFVLCPLGTKLQTLGSFAFAYQNKAVTVAYVSSLSYFTEQYSRGYEKKPVEIDMGQLLQGSPGYI